jgi:site-specific DNA-methyltransferase (adenine-specific)/modification methylase
MNNLELNKIYCESNLETMKRMEDKSIDYVLTSPPYNVKTERIAKYKDFKDGFSQEQYFDQQKELITELLRVTKNHIFYNIQMLSGNKIALHKLIGHFANNIKEMIIWHKGFGEPAISENVFNSGFEYIIVFSNNEPNKRFFNDANFKRGTQSNVFKIVNSHSNPFADVHKAIMPLDIPRYFMINFGKENDIWFDPYMGTGTTAVACIEEKRKFIGSEISKEYVDLANKRLKPYLTQQTLF